MGHGVLYANAGDVSSDKNDVWYIFLQYIFNRGIIHAVVECKVSRLTCFIISVFCACKLSAFTNNSNDCAGFVQQ